MIRATRYWIIWTTHRAGAQSLCSGSLTVPALRMKREEVVEPDLSAMLLVVVFLSSFVVTMLRLQC